MHLTTPSRSARTVVEAALLAGSLLLVTACGSGEVPAPVASPVAAPVRTTTSPATLPAAPTATPAAAAPHETVRSTPVSLPWPARDEAATAALQATADSGGQPWLLDPLDLAQAYATATHGWRTATVSTAGPGRVRISDGGSAVLVTVGQPARTGRGGIWVVTGEQPA